MIEEKVITEVTAGWVVFSTPGAESPQVVRRTVATHRLCTGKEPRVGDVYKFRVHPCENDGVNHLYAPEEIAK